MLRPAHQVSSLNGWQSKAGDALGLNSASIQRSEGAREMLKNHIPSRPSPQTHHRKPHLTTMS